MVESTISTHARAHGKRIRASIADEIRYIRLRKRITQAELAALFNKTKPPDLRDLTQKDISRYENGDVRISAETFIHLKSLIDKD